jgi:hypothetical protein
MTYTDPDGDRFEFTGFVGHPHPGVVQVRDAEVGLSADALRHLRDAITATLDEPPTNTEPAP